MIRTDPVGRLLFNVLAMMAEFESDLIRLRTREGMKVAKPKGRLRGKQPKLKPNQAKHLLELHDSGNYTQAELAELFGVGRSTIYRTIERILPKPPEPGSQPVTPSATSAPQFDLDPPAEQANPRSTHLLCTPDGSSIELGGPRPPQLSWAMSAWHWRRVMRRLGSGGSSCLRRGSPLR